MVTSDGDRHWLHAPPATDCAAERVESLAPPAVMIRALGSPLQDAPTEIQIEATGEKFDRLVARVKTDGLLIANGVNVASPEFWIVVGDEVNELRRLESET
jgi:hypothetical protein